MRIIYISHWRFPSEKSLSGFSVESCSSLVRAGAKIELWIPRRINPKFRNKDPFNYYQVDQNFIIRRLPVIDLMGVLPGKFSFFLLLVTFNISLGLYILVRGLRKKAIFYFHDLRDAVLPAFLAGNTFFEIHDFYKSSVSWLNRWCFSGARGFIVTNRIKIQSLRDEFSIPEGRLLHQPNAVDLIKFGLSTSKDEARKFLNLPLNQKIILYTGHLYEWKGAHVLFDAHRCLSPGETIYFNGGTDEDIEKFKVKSEKLKVENVVMVGRGPREEVPLWLRAADILVLPNTAKDPASRLDTSPLKLFEYMASARPIVASDLPSIRDIVDEKAVWFFEPDSPADLCRVVHLALARGDESEEKARRAKKEAAKYTWEKRSEAIINFLKVMTSAN